MSPNPLRILLVEDDPEQVQLFILILSMDGYVLIPAAEAESAMARLAETPFVLLLVDWDLPGVKGDTLITTVRAHYPDVKTILYSNHAHVDQAAVVCGADGWFRKMDNTNHLRQIITELLQGVSEP